MKQMIGEKFGKLTVVQRVEDYVAHNGKHRIMYLCKCDCGNEKVIRGEHLRSGHTQSCGCLRKEISKEISDEHRKILKENARKNGIKNRKHFGCMYCGSDVHYAKGLCRNCYNKARRKTLE